MKAVDVSCGDSFSIVLDESGNCWAFGKGSHGRLGLGSDENIEEPVKIEELTNILQISAGCRHASAITRRGELFMWGFNFYNQLGLGDQDRDSDRPLKVDPALFKNQQVKSVSCGYFHTSALIQN